MIKIDDLPIEVHKLAVVRAIETFMDAETDKQKIACWILILNALDALVESCSKKFSISP